MQNLHQLLNDLDIWRHTLYKSVTLRRGEVFPRITLQFICIRQPYIYIYIYIYIYNSDVKTSIVLLKLRFLNHFINL